MGRNDLQSYEKHIKQTYPDTTACLAIFKQHEEKHQDEAFRFYATFLIATEDWQGLHQLYSAILQINNTDEDYRFPQDFIYTCASQLLKNKDFPAFNEDDSPLNKLNDERLKKAIQAYTLLFTNEENSIEEIKDVNCTPPNSSKDEDSESDVSSEEEERTPINLEIARLETHRDLKNLTEQAHKILSNNFEKNCNVKTWTKDAFDYFSCYITYCMAPNTLFANDYYQRLLKKIDEELKEKNKPLKKESALTKFGITKHRRHLSADSHLTEEILQKIREVRVR